MTTDLSLSMLGALQITVDQQSIIGFESNKVRALLAYLAIEADRPHPREVLAGLLWPEFSNRAALNNLRYALSNLRKAIDDHVAHPPYLLIQNVTIQFNPSSHHFLDVRDFLESIESGEVERLKHAVSLYRGTFLEGFAIPDSSAFEDWVLLKREQLNRRMLQALRQLADYYEQRAEYEPALHYAWQQVELEPWQEEGHQQLMRLLVFNGQRSAALVQYETCRRLLADELGVEPSAETTALYQRIADGTLTAPTYVPAPPAFLDPNAQSTQVEQPLFVAREAELAKLEGYLKNVLTGHGQVAFITGEPGSGKTMLFQEFTRRVLTAHPEVMVVNGNCNAYTGIGDPYLPFLEMLAMLTGEVEIRWAGGAISTEHARRLWQLLPEVLDTLVEDGLELIDRFVSGAALSARARSGAPSHLAKLEALLKSKAAKIAAAGMQQNDLFEQYSQVLQRLAGSHPLLLFVDDLQWADTGSISLLFHLGKRLPGHRILLLGAYRPGEVAAGRDGGRHPLEAVLNELQRDYGDNQVDLSKAENRRWIDTLLDSEPNHLGENFRETLFWHTNGHALFTVELLRGLQERGDLVKDEAGCWVKGKALDWDTLPPRIEAVIAESVGRLPETLQRTLAIASVEGETFTAQVVSRVQNVADEEVIEWLSGRLSKMHRLVIAAGFQRVRERRIAVYRFRHYLFQKYLYIRLDEVERAHLHETIGNSLEALYGDQSHQIALQLARHFEISGLTARSVKYLHLAGDQATRLYANIEAINHYQRALGLLQTMPDTPERALIELRLRTALTVPLTAMRGFSDLEMEQNIGRARELTRQVETGPDELFQVLSGLKSYYDLRLSLRAAHELGEDMVKLAEKLDDPFHLSFAYHHISTTTLYLGQLRAFLEFHQRASELYDREEFRTIIFPQGLDPKVAGLVHAGLTYWLLGYPEQARQKSREAMAWANELGHPFMIAWARYFTAQLHAYLHEVAMTRKFAEETIAISQDIGAAVWLAAGNVLMGWVLAEQGQFAEAIPRQEQSLATLGMIGAEAGRIQQAPLLLDAYARAGKAVEGLALVEEVLKKASAAEYRLVEPDLLRCKGELLLANGDPEAEAEACFWQSIESARQIEAKSWELRAALSLCRLWQRQGKHEAAHKLLAPVYSWFTEGFDTPDLKEARRLLNELVIGRIA